MHPSSSASLSSSCHPSFPGTPDIGSVVSAAGTASAASTSAADTVMHDGNARTCADKTWPVALSISGGDVNDTGAAVDGEITREDVSEPARATSVPQLSGFAPIERPDFRWRKLGGEEFSQTIPAAYYEVTRWRRNIF